jgi:hypothetical protein
MKRGMVLLMVFFLVCALSGVSEAWQGRMAGMGDPYGLVQDESDFLTHPSKIANGEGVRFYVDYRFTCTEIMVWDYAINHYTPGGVWTGLERDDVSNEVLRHSALAGVAFPLGPGRMGLFFTYNGIRGGTLYNGDYINSSGGSTILETKSVVNDFALRLLYGMPIVGFKVGAEAQIAYRLDIQETNVYTSTDELLNYYAWPMPITVYMYPHDSSYWDTQFKGSLEGKAGPLDLEFTLRGGFDFGGTNKWHRENQSLSGTPILGFDAKGDVRGWQIGEDLWLRYPLATDLTLPFLVRVDYQQKTRDGDGLGWGLSAGDYNDYENEKRDLAIIVGGGLDKAFGKDTRIAAGIYYNYLQGRESFSLLTIHPVTWENDDTNYPDTVEHQVLLRMAGEHTLSPAVALRAGLSFFYGWVDVRYDSTHTDNSGYLNIDRGTDHGSHWGIGASIGGTITVKTITLEPFMNCGYQQFRLKGDGERFDNVVGLVELHEEEFPRNEWYLGIGLSLLFGL